VLSDEAIEYKHLHCLLKLCICLSEETLTIFYIRTQGDFWKLLLKVLKEQKPLIDITHFLLSDPLLAPGPLTTKVEHIGKKLPQLNLNQSPHLSLPLLRQYPQGKQQYILGLRVILVPRVVLRQSDKVVAELVDFELLVQVLSL